MNETRNFYRDLAQALENKDLADKIVKQIIDDGVLFAFAGFYARDKRLKMQDVLANMVLHMCDERRELRKRM